MVALEMQALIFHLKLLTFLTTPSLITNNKQHALIEETLIVTYQTMF